MRRIGLAVVVVAVCLAVPAVAEGAMGAGTIPLTSPVLRTPSPPPPVVPSRTNATFQWVDGGLVSHAYYRGCFPEFWFGHFVTNYVGQYVATDLSAPKSTTSTTCTYSRESLRRARARAEPTSAPS